MTYCCGILVRDGLVMMADTRTNAGLDNISTFRKLHVFGVPGQRIMALAPSVTVETTDWLIDRLPEEASAMMRCPGTPNTCSLRKVEILSRPALVRVSAIITRPSRTRIPQQ